MAHGWFWNREREREIECQSRPIFHCQELATELSTDWSELGLSAGQQEGQSGSGRSEFLLGIAFSHISSCPINMGGGWGGEGCEADINCRKRLTDLVGWESYWVWVDTEGSQIIHWFLEACCTYPCSLFTRSLGGDTSWKVNCMQLLQLILSFHRILKSCQLLSFHRCAVQCISVCISVHFNAV